MQTFNNKIPQVKVEKVWGMVKFGTKKTKSRKSFVRVAKGALESAGNAVVLLHKESPFR